MKTSGLVQKLKVTDVILCCKYRVNLSNWQKRYNNFIISLTWMKTHFDFYYSVPQVFGGSFTDRNLPDAQSNLGLWGDGRGEDELSPEEIQMVCLSCVWLSVLLYFLLYSCVVIKKKYRFSQINFSHFMQNNAIRRYTFCLWLSGSSGSS